MQPSDVRVDVEHVCLDSPADARTNETCPGGGLVGTVVECGDAATALMGARVLVPPVIACGECDTCRRGAATACPTRSILGVDRHGGCAASVVCAGRWLTRTDEGLDLEGPLAALVAGPGLHAYALFCRAGVTAGDVVIVLGNGPTAAILGRLAVSRGAKLVFPDTGASTSGVQESLAQQGSQQKPQKIFVCDGDAGLALAFEVAHPSSLIVSAVATGSASMESLLARELSLLALQYGHPDLLPEAAALVVKGDLEIGDILAEGTLGSGSLEEAQHALREGKCLVVRHG